MPISIDTFDKCIFSIILMLNFLFILSSCMGTLINFVILSSLLVQFCKEELVVPVLQTRIDFIFRHN
jgi:hypothetical protein